MAKSLLPTSTFGHLVYSLSCVCTSQCYNGKISSQKVPVRHVDMKGGGGLEKILFHDIAISQ